MRVRPAGDAALLVDCDSTAEVHAVAAAVRAAAPAGVEEVVPGARTGLVVVDPADADLGAIARTLEMLRPAGTRAHPGRQVTIEVVYDGPDLEEVAALTRLRPGEVVERHAARDYTVAFCGFSPGFAYLDGGDPALAVPRRSTPRPRVEAGAVAMAGSMSAVYPQATPGGWQLIGRAAPVLFDAGREPPSLLSPGDRVRFVPVDSLRPPTPTRGRPPAPPARWMTVVRAGPLTTVQDRGRVGFAHLGVPRAGALDPASMAAANRAVGNPEMTACLEATVTGPVLRPGVTVRMAVAGAGASLVVDGDKAGPGPVVVAPGSTVAVRLAGPGLRAYVAVDGGIEAEPVLGSRSTDTLSGLGPAVVADGDVIGLGPGAPDRPPGAGAGSLAPARSDAGPGAAVTVRVVPGPRDDMFPPAALEALLGAEWAVSPNSDRAGIRLHGPPVPAPSRAVPSEGTVAGAVQVPPDGAPIILLANRGTTGGYPVLAVVAVADLPVLAQVRPGRRLRFEPVAPPVTAAASAPWTW